MNFPTREMRLYGLLESCKIIPLVCFKAQSDLRIALILAKFAKLDEQALSIDLTVSNACNMFFVSIMFDASLCRKRNHREATSLESQRSIR